MSHNRGGGAQRRKRYDDHNDYGPKPKKARGASSNRGSRTDKSGAFWERVGPPNRSNKTEKSGNCFFFCNEFIGSRFKFTYIRSFNFHII